MANPNILDQDRVTRSASQPASDSAESFGDILSQYEQSHSHRAADGERGLTGTVVAISGESSGTPSRKAFNPTARYIAPLSRCV